MALNVTVLTIFPEVFPGFLGYSLTGRALERGLWSLKAVNIRDYACSQSPAAHNWIFHIF